MDSHMGTAWHRGFLVCATGPGLSGTLFTYTSFQRWARKARLTASAPTLHCLDTFFSSAIPTNSPFPFRAILEGLDSATRDPEGHL